MPAADSATVAGRYPGGALATMSASLTSCSSRAAAIATDRGRIDLEDFHHPTRATFTAFRAAMTELQGDPFSGTLPRDPDYLAWTLSALAPLPMAERQSLLEAEGATERLTLVTRLLTDELRAINVIPSLPATQVARTAWSPN